MKHDRTIREISIDDTKSLLVVSLGRNAKGGEAIIDKDDFERLVAMGLSPTWNRHPNGYVTAPASKASGRYVVVARVLLDAHAGMNVRYKDGNPLNLRRENIELVGGGWSIRRDRDFLTPLDKIRGRKVRDLVIQHA